MQRSLQPGELTKPVRVWCTSTSIRIAWYQAEPLSEQVTIFYKKTGSLFGTEIVLPTASLLGPDLSMRGPDVVGGGRAEYYELDIRKLKPNTQYVVKVRAGAAAINSANEDEQGLGAGMMAGLLGTGTAGHSVRSDRLSTLAPQEESKRNLDMGNFIGSLIKLGDYDGTVLTFDAATGLYEVRVLQVEEVGTAPQLLRLASQYSDLGLPVRTFTLSAIRFGRWGGEISDSQVVGETELRWIVGRSVALAERNEAAGNFAVREGLMQAQNEQLLQQMDSQRLAALASLTYTRRIYLMMFAVLTVLAVLAVGWAWGAAWRYGQVAAIRVTQAQAEVHDLQDELRRLQLYRTSLELDAGAWILAAAAAQRGVTVAAYGRGAQGARGGGRAAGGASPAQAPAASPPPQRQPEAGDGGGGGGAAFGFAGAGAAGGNGSSGAAAGVCAASGPPGSQQQQVCTKQDQQQQQQPFNDSKQGEQGHTSPPPQGEQHQQQEAGHHKEGSSSWPEGTGQGPAHPLLDVRGPLLDALRVRNRNQTAARGNDAAEGGVEEQHKRRRRASSAPGVADGREDGAGEAGARKQQQHQQQQGVSVAGHATPPAAAASGAGGKAPQPERRSWRAWLWPGRQRGGGAADEAGGGPAPAPAASAADGKVEHRTFQSWSSRLLSEEQKRELAEEDSWARWFEAGGGEEEFGAYVDASVDPPQPWTYVQHAATLYSVYLQEWLKHQLAKSIRTNIHALLISQQEGQGHGHAQQQQPGAEGEGGDGSSQAGAGPADPGGDGAGGAASPAGSGAGDPTAAARRRWSADMWKAVVGRWPMYGGGGGGGGAGQGGAGDEPATADGSGRARPAVGKAAAGARGSQQGRARGQQGGGRAPSPRQQQQARGRVLPVPGRVPAAEHRQAQRWRGGSAAEPPYDDDGAPVPVARHAAPSGRGRRGPGQQHRQVRYEQVPLYSYDDDGAYAGAADDGAYDYE